MQRNPHCYLTMQDFTILEALLEQEAHDQAFFRLLRQKLGNTTVVFRDEVDPPVATIGSRVDFVIDGGMYDSRILSADGGSGLSRLTLPVTTMRGLALLGLAAGDSVIVEWSRGESERLRVDRVYPQLAAPKEASIVAFAPRRKPVGPDDDPGPRAA